MRTIPRFLASLVLAVALASVTVPGHAQAASGTIAVRPHLKVTALRGTAQLRQGKNHSVKLGVSGGTAPYTWTATGLPEGMTVKDPAQIYCITTPCPQATGNVLRFSGVPTMSGAYAARVVVTDAAGIGASLTIPFTVVPHGHLAVSVTTDKRAYRADQTMGFTVVVRNEGNKAEAMQFRTTCQAGYEVAPGSSSAEELICGQALTSVTLLPGEERVYPFSYRFADHPQLGTGYPYDVTVTGRVIGVSGASATVTVRKPR